MINPDLTYAILVLLGMFFLMHIASMRSARATLAPFAEWLQNPSTSKRIMTMTTEGYYQNRLVKVSQCGSNKSGYYLKISTPSQGPTYPSSAWRRDPELCHDFYLVDGSLIQTMIPWNLSNFTAYFTGKTFTTPEQAKALLDQMVEAALKAERGDFKT